MAQTTQFWGHGLSRQTQTINLALPYIGILKQGMPAQNYHALTHPNGDSLLPKVAMGFPSCAEEGDEEKYL